MKRQDYLTPQYLNYQRWQSLWHQLDLTRHCSPKNILEIGSGSGLITHILKKSGYQVTTLDNDPQLKPDIIADLNSFSFKKNQFDLILCCQVLEHLSFKNFLPLLKKLKKTTKKHLIISLPEDSLSSLQFALKLIPFIPLVKKIVNLPRQKPLPKGGPHHWEINRPNYPLKKIIRTIEKSGFQIKKSFLVFENPYHRFFLLQK